MEHRTWNLKLLLQLQKRGDGALGVELGALCPWSFSQRLCPLSSGNLDGEQQAAERTVEDVFLRKFMLGTFPGCLADQVVLKRRANQVDICALVLRQLPAHKFYFLVGYSETLLGHFYKCPVRLHLQTVPAKVVYKYI